MKTRANVAMVVGIAAVWAAILAPASHAGEGAVARLEWAPPEAAPGAGPVSRGPTPLLERDTLTDYWFGYGPEFEDNGVVVALSTTQVYQPNTIGGIATRRRKNRWAGSYDLELFFDLEKLAGLEGGTLFSLTEGSYNDGIDEGSVGSLFGVNDDAGGDRAADVTELWYQQSLSEGRFQFRVGKIDLTGTFECRGCGASFDGNQFANDETAQFLNAALVNNPSIPFPDNGLGAMVYVEAVPGWYVSAGIADAQADARETGFNTAFRDEDYFLSIYEAGCVADWPSGRGPLRGTYRAGLWYDPQPKDRLDGTGSERDDLGFYASCDQVLLRESDDPDDAQGLGLFARFGWADEDLNEIRRFWSAGLQYQGAIPGRDDDVCAVGVAQGRLSRDAGFAEGHETVIEAYYRVAVAPWLDLTPSVQHVINPGGGGTDDATLVGLRFQASF
jgi:porin